MTHKEADRLIRKMTRVGLIQQADKTMQRWIESVGLYLPKKELNVGASRCCSDPALKLGWQAAIGDILRRLPEPTGQCLIDRYLAWYERCYAEAQLDPLDRLELYHRRKHERDRRSAQKAGLKPPTRKEVRRERVDRLHQLGLRLRRLDQQIAHKQGLIWFACEMHRRGL